MTCQNGQSPQFKYHHQLKIKEDVEGSGFGLQKAGRQFTLEKEKQVFYTQIFVGHAETHADTEWTLISKAQ